MNKNVTLVVGAIAIAVVAFAGGALLAPKIPFLANASGVAAGRQGGPFGNLSSEERQKLQSMTDDERQKYMAEKFGGQMPGGGPGGAPGRGRGAMTVDGEIVDVAADSITVKTSDSGSQVVYYDSETIVSYAKGAQQKDLAPGMQVLIVAQPEADQVNSADAIVVK